MKRTVRRQMDAWTSSWKAVGVGRFRYGLRAPYRGGTFVFIFILLFFWIIVFPPSQWREIYKEIFALTITLQ